MGRSYNALSVPLTSDWQCSLIPIRDLPDVDRGWKLSYDERQQARKERDEQIEQDRQDFDRLFRVSIDRRAARSCTEFRAYAAFISEHLRILGLSAPVDGDGVTRILSDAVRNGQLVPAISRAWCGSRRVVRQYAPQSWPKRAPDAKPTIYSFRDGQLVPLDASGRFNVDTPYVSARVAANAAASAGSSGGSGGSGFDWLGAAESVAGAVLGGASSSDGDSMLKSFGDTDDGEGSSLLSDAQPFEYVPDALSDDVTELAARGVRMTGNEPGGFAINPNGQDVDYFDSTGNLSAQYHGSHGDPHGHNFSGGVRDNTHLPMSPISFN